MNKRTLQTGTNSKTRKLLLFLFLNLSFFTLPAQPEIGGQDPFFQAVKNLETLNFTIRGMEDCEYAESSTGACRVEPQNNWINSRIAYFTELWKGTHEDRIPTRVDDTQICRIRKFSLKSTQETQAGSNTYVRFHVVEWKCKSKEAAKKVVKILNAYSGMSWERLDKSPTTLWRDGDAIYFIRIGGWFVLPHVEAIQNALIESLASS